MPAPRPATNLALLAARFLLPHRWRVAAALVGLQDFPRDGAGVLGVDVDAAALQRLLEDRGVAEARLVRAAGGLGEDLAEDVGLGEALGADRGANCEHRICQNSKNEERSAAQKAQETFSTCTRQS